MSEKSLGGGTPLLQLFSNENPKEKMIRQIVALTRGVEHEKAQNYQPIVNKRAQAHKLSPMPKSKRRLKVKVSDDFQGGKGSD